MRGQLAAEVCGSEGGFKASGGPGEDQAPQSTAWLGPEQKSFFT